MEMTGGEALATQLINEGVQHVFGVPGVQLDFAVDGLARHADQIAYRNTRHEQAAAYMADGYARTTGRVGVCMVVPGPGLLNAMAGLATAYACSSPVLCIAGQIPSTLIGRNLGILHEVVDQSRILASVTKWQALARSPQDIPKVVHEAFCQLRGGRPRPVGVEIPPDVLQATGSDITFYPAAAAEPVRPDPAVLDEAADVLRRAERPVIYAGGGVVAAAAWDELRALAELLEAPVIMTTAGRGALPDSHRLALTSLAGREILPAADAVLVVGSRFVNGQARSPVTAEGARIVLVNADHRDLGAPRRPTVAVHADSRLGLSSLCELLHGAPSRRSRRDELDAARDVAAKRIAEIEPQRSWVAALRSAVPEEGILVSELTQVGYLSQVAYPVLHPRTYVTPGYQGTLGYGFATALGVKAGNPDRPVVCITGDGGFGWTLAELATARKYDLGLVTIVFNDGAFGNVLRSQQSRFDGRVLGTKLANPDFLKLADAFAISGVRVSSPSELEGAVTDAVAASEPVLIEAMVSSMPSSWHLLHDFLDKRPRRQE